MWDNYDERTELSMTAKSDASTRAHFQFGEDNHRARRVRSFVNQLTKVLHRIGEPIQGH